MAFPSSAGPITRFARNALLKKILEQLQPAKLATKIQIAVVTGGGANAELTAATIETADKILGALNVKAEGGNLKEITALTNLTIPANGKVKTATATTGNTLVVFFIDASA